MAKKPSAVSPTKKKKKKKETKSFHIGNHLWSAGLDRSGSALPSHFTVAILSNRTRIFASFRSSVSSTYIVKGRPTRFERNTAQKSLALTRPSPKLDSSNTVIG